MKHMEPFHRLGGLCIAVAALSMSIGGVRAYAQEARPVEGGTYEWSMELDCTLCHQKEADSFIEDAEATSKDIETTLMDTGEDGVVPEKDDAVLNYAAEHVNGFGLECTTCHEESEGLNKAHSKLNSGKEARRLKKSEVPSGVCLSCHNQEDLAEATFDVALIDDKGTKINPHDLPAGTKHEEINCVGCHAVHSAPDDLEEAAVDMCISCHHAGIFECNTCH